MKALILPAAIILIFFSCSRGLTEYGRITGFTQGTTYSVVYEGISEYKQEFIREETERIFRDIDFSLSVYNDSSVISRINRNEEIKPDEYFRELFSISMQISGITGGAFDITVMPLVKAWGFGPDEHRNFDLAKLDSLRALVGYNKVKMEDDRIIKSVPAVTLDMNAIAQGYTADVLSRYFDNLGINSYLIEIGGEVRVKGTKAGNHWKIGIDRPADSNMIPGEDLQAIIRLKDRSLATSGNYRKFYVEDGIKYSHTIDPATGYPARSRLLSATILADDCATADAVATACMVMGLERSVEFILKNPGMDAYLIYSDEYGKFGTWISEGLKRFIDE